MDKEEVIGKVLGGLILIFLGPALFRWIWNWQFSDIYVFTYWQVFWLGMGISCLLWNFKKE